MGLYNLLRMSDFQENGHLGKQNSAHLYFARMVGKRHRRFVLAALSTYWEPNKGVRREDS